ncbi:hypothetical protein [Saccharopolyspora taberi]|uniref:Uncharacterized protein n=1 Tax=Saccharopolyspora taberi TaxID=60895 RepID=A0ABN3VG58_9PSEU
MITTLAPRPASPRMFGLHDYRRSYVLPTEVDTNILRTGSAGEFGSWNHARGVLVEVSRCLRAMPVALNYRELETGPARLPVGIEVTAIARDDAGALVTVISRQESAPYGPRGDYWQLTVNGVVPEDGISSSPPSLPWMANLVRLALRP